MMIIHYHASDELLVGEDNSLLVQFSALHSLELA